MTSQRLPNRSLLMPHKEIAHYDGRELREIADWVCIRGIRREFYKHAHYLAVRYHFDCWIEHDLHALNNVNQIFRKALIDGTNFAASLGAITTTRQAYSWYREMHFDGDSEVDIPHLQKYVTEFVEGLGKVTKQLPRVPPGRRPRLALRNWANSHMDFWENRIGGNITAPNDGSGMSRCHRFLHCLLKPIDEKSARYLLSIVRERRSD